LPVITLGVVSILGLEPTLFFPLSPEENKDKALGKGFLEAEETKMLPDECLTI